MTEGRRPKPVFSRPPDDEAALDAWAEKPGRRRAGLR